MFGFLKLKNCHLSSQERLIYQSHFCSACHAMTSFGGRVSSLLTNYDITFWLLLQSALDSRPLLDTDRLPCTALPFRKVSVQALRPRVSQTMAALNLLLVSSKVDDDEADGERWKSIAARALYLKKFQKARSFLQEEGYSLESVRGLHEAQSQAESELHPTLDSLCQPTSAALGEVFSTIAKLHGQAALQKDLQSFGENLGGFLYLWDAFIDLKQDRAKGTFNALQRVHQGHLAKAEVFAAYSDRLSSLRNTLDSLALGPEGRLCYELLHSLNLRFEQDFPRPVSAAPIRPRQRWKKAGMVRTQDCCELDCCECGSCCDCNICDCNPCDSGHECCEFSCCSWEDFCCCCCCDTRSTRRSDCCGSHTSSHQVSCCGESEPSHRRSGNLMTRWKENKTSRNLPAIVGQASQRSCPRCVKSMLELQVGSVGVDECRDCGGIWLDDKELDELAKMPKLPHNLLHRYPSQEFAAQHLPGERSCPKCKTSLVVVPYLGVSVEMCRDCHGFWLEHGVLNKVLRAKRSPQRLLGAHKKEWRCPYCEKVAAAGSDVCLHCGAPRPKSGFTGKLA